MSSGKLEDTAFHERTRTIYGWDGDTLALESSVHQGYSAGERTVHYVYERDSFVPLVQATRSRSLRMGKRPNYGVNKPMINFIEGQINLGAKNILAVSNKDLSALAEEG